MRVFHELVGWRAGGSRVWRRSAGAQHGAGARCAAAAAGDRRRAIRHRVATGSLHRGAPVGVRGRHRGAAAARRAETAALLYAGDDAVLSHETAAALWGLDRYPLLRGHHVDRPPHHGAAGAARPPGHGARHPRRAHAPGLPVTSPARTLIDCAARRPGTRPVAQRGAGAEAGQRTPRSQAAMERCPRPQGRSRPLRALLEAERDTGFTRSKAERRAEAAGARGRARAARCSTRCVEGVEVDAYWPRLKAGVEVDGYQFHGHYQAFQRDRAKANRLVAAGLRGAPVHLAPAHRAAHAGRRPRSPDAGPPRGAGGLNTDLQPLQSGRCWHAVRACGTGTPCSRFWWRRRSRRRRRRWRRGWPDGWARWISPGSAGCRSARRRCWAAWRSWPRCWWPGSSGCRPRSSCPTCAHGPAGTGRRSSTSGR